MNLSLLSKCVLLSACGKTGRMFVFDSAVAVDSTTTVVSAHTPARVVPE